MAWVNTELWLIVLALGVGVIAALLPAWRAYRTDVAATLARG
jgi:putative ABC transport system permease protein